MPSFEETHSRDVSGKTYAQQSPGVLQEAHTFLQIVQSLRFSLIPLIFWIEGPKV